MELDCFIHTGTATNTSNSHLHIQSFYVLIYSIPHLIPSFLPTGGGEAEAGGDGGAGQTQSREPSEA